MQHQRSESKGTAKLRPLFESDELNISNNSKRPFNGTKRHCKRYSRAIEMQQTSALCFGTKILFLSGSFSRKAGIHPSHI